jgi:hypothetical protein
MHLEGTSKNDCLVSLHAEKNVCTYFTDPREVFITVRDSAGTSTSKRAL